MKILFKYLDTAYSALTLVVRSQEEHPAWKIE